MKASQGCTAAFGPTFVSDCPEREPCATDCAESDLALSVSESRAEHRHLVLHVRACERKDPSEALIVYRPDLV